VQSLWLRFVVPPKGGVRLESAEVGAVYDDEGTWPTELRLRGFTYDHLESSDPVPVEKRLFWLERDPEGYALQPYGSSSPSTERRETSTAPARWRWKSSAAAAASSPPTRKPGASSWVAPWGTGTVPGMPPCGF
jgi:hypothetical protein